jgi:capsular polysaccharide biosynthesis protein
MIKIILIIVISVTIFGWLFFIIVRNTLKKRLDILVEQEKKDKLNNSK